MELKTGDSIIVDFDGVIVDEEYPNIGKIKNSHIFHFLNTCKRHGIKVYVWSARCNNYFGDNPKFPIYGFRGMQQIDKFMKKNKLYYTDFLIQHKPISKLHAKMIVDDCSFKELSTYGIEFKKC